MDNPIAFLVAVMITASVTSCVTDQATLRGCAVVGASNMVVGGTIECSVRKETK